MFDHWLPLSMPLSGRARILNVFTIGEALSCGPGMARGCEYDELAPQTELAISSRFGTRAHGGCRFHANPRSFRVGSSGLTLLSGRLSQNRRRRGIERRRIRTCEPEPYKSRNPPSWFF